MAGTADLFFDPVPFLLTNIPSTARHHALSHCLYLLKHAIIFGGTDIQDFWRIKMNKWFYVNFFILVLGLWNVFTHFSFPALLLHISLGLLGLLLILFNWTRHAMYSTIRDSHDRKKKIRIAQLIKKDMPFHRWTGTAALIIILMHGSIAAAQFDFQWNNGKLLSGLFAAIILTAVVATGWMRRIRPTGRKRMAHLYLGLSLVFLIIIHLLL